jgi:hypothetical protein
MSEALGLPRARRTIAAAVVVSAAFAAVVPGAAHAQTNWSAGSGDWFDAANWSAGVPTSAIDANVANGGTANIAATPAVAQNLNLGGATGSGSLDLTGATTTLSTTGTYVGRAAGGIGSFTLTDARHAVGNLYVGYDAGSVGQYQINSGGARFGAFNGVSTRTIGYAGSGTLTQDGGTLSGTLKLGDLATGSGLYRLNAGSYATSTLVQVGLAGGGTVQQAGGTFSTISTLLVGQATPGTGHGVYNLSAGSLSAQKVNVGLNSTFAQSGGTFAGDLVVTPTSTYRLTGGSANVGTAQVANTTLHLDGGAFTAQSITSVGPFGSPWSVDVTAGTHDIGSIQLNNDGALNYSGGSLTLFSLSGTGFNAMMNFVDFDPAAPPAPIVVTSLGNLVLDVDLAPDSWQLIEPDDAFVLFQRAVPGSLLPSFQVPSGGRLTVDGGSFQLNYGSSSEFGGSKVVLSDFQHVPEPSGVFAIIALTTTALRRRRRNVVSNREGVLQ